MPPYRFQIYEGLINRAGILPICVATYLKKALNLVRQGIYLLFDKMPLKSPLKIHSKLGYTRVLELLLKVRFVMLRQTKKVCFVVLRRTR